MQGDNLCKEKISPEGEIMHEEHPCIEKSTNKNKKIWRYLDFTKFVSILDR